jgi:Sulfotransferase family
MQPARAAAPRPIGTDFPVLIHFHIYKNAGSSIDRLLAESFGDAWTTFEDPSHDIIDCHRLRRLLAARPGLRAVSSHRFRAPLPCRSARPMVMLRHPVDRARSIYHFARRDPTQHDHAVARNGSFADYVEHYLPQKDAGVVIRDYQVVHLSDASMRCRHNTQLARATPDDLALVKTRLAEWRLFGLVRRFADSCRLFAAAYEGDFPELRLREVRENVFTDATLTDADTLTLAQAELGAATFGRLLDANALDLELYEFARQRFEEISAATSSLPSMSLDRAPEVGTPRPHSAAQAPHTP